MCVGFNAPKTKVEHAKFIFSGRVASVRGHHVELDIDRMYLGSLEKKLMMSVEPYEKRCGYAFEEGREYLVFATLDRDNNVTTDLCSGNVPLICARPELEYLHEEFAAPDERGPFEARRTPCLDGPYLLEGSRALMTTYVGVELIVDVEGNVKSLQFEQPQSEELEKAVRAWRFKPATLNGKAVEARLTYIGPKDPRTEKEAEAYRW